MLTRCCQGAKRAGLVLALSFLLTSTAHAIEYVATTTSSGNSNSPELDLPGGVADEDVLIAHIVIRGGSGVSWTAPSGWTLIRTHSTADMTQRTYYRVTGATEPASYTWNLSGGNRRTASSLSAYRNVAQVDPIDVQNGQTGTGSTVTAPSVTTNVSGTRLIGAFSAASGNASFSEPTGMTIRANLNSGGGPNNGVAAMLADEPRPAADTTGIRTSNSGSNSANAAQLIALRPPAPGEAVVTLTANGSTDDISVASGEEITLEATVENCTTGDAIGPYYDTWRQDADNLIDPEEFTDSPCDRAQPITFPDNPLVINTEGVYTIRFITGYDDADAGDTLEDGRDALQITVGDPGDDTDDPFRLPDCAEAFGDAHLNVHDGEQGNLNLREGSRVFNSEGVGANASGPSRLQQQAGTYCIADDDPNDPSPGACGTVGSVRSWEDAGREFPEPPSGTYPGTEGNLTVTSANSPHTITTAEGDPKHYNQITIENGGHLIIEGDGEVTSDGRFMGNPGARLTMNGTPILNVDARFEFGGSAARSHITVNGSVATSVDTFARGNIILRNTEVRVSEGTWRPMTTSQGGDINVTTGSDLNCDPTHTPGADWQPANVMPDCDNDTGGIFMVSRSTGSVLDSAVRAFIYVDGTQYNVRRSLIKGSLTSGGNTLRESDFVPDGIPTTGGFCEERIDDIRVEAGALASTCRRHPVTLTALDRFGQQLYTYRDTMELQTSSNHGDWFRVDDEGDPGDPEATNAPTHTGDDSGSGRQNFDPDDLGQVQIFLENIHADDLVITATDMEEGVSGTSDAVEFRDNVFVIESVDDRGHEHVSVDDVVAGRDHLFEATLWQRDRDPEAEQRDCDVPTSYNSTSQTVRMSIERDSNDPGGDAPYVNPVGDGGPVHLDEERDVILDFSGNTTDPGRARFELQTSDVGKYAILMAEDTSGFAVDDEGPRKIEGGSGNYVVRPFGFDIQVSEYDSNTAPEGPGGSWFRRAGQEFEITVRAVGYVTDADGDGDRMPDGYTGLMDDSLDGRADLSGAPTLASFGKEGNNAASAVVQSALWLPDGDGREDPDLELTQPESGDFAADEDSGSGTATVDVRYDEVGIIVLNAAFDNYMGVNDRNLRGGKAVQVGRFIPAYYTLETGEIEDRTALNCTPDSTFTYMGEDFLLRDFELVARPDTHTIEDSKITQNYQGNFAFLDPVNSEHLNVAGFAGEDQILIDDLNVRSLSSDGWVSGVLNDLEIVLRVSRVCDSTNGDCPKDPYEALAVGLKPEDPEDPVELGTFDLPNDNETHAQAAEAQRIRFGRLVIDNVHGSELAPLTLNMRAEYWDGQTWQVNTDDSCTPITDFVNEVRLYSESADDEEGTAEVTIGEGQTQLIDEEGNAVDSETSLTLQSGTGSFTFQAADPGTGWVELRVDLDEADLGYLGNEAMDGDWGADPRGRATFGIFAGPRGRIIIQEVDPG